jgi:thymidylate synthase (FAD)
MKVKLIWITPDAEKIILQCAKVQVEKEPEIKNTRLINYLIHHKHWSPFEMASMCVEVETTRDISRQVIRHRSFSYQEFSQRYHKVVADPIFREARLQDAKNRQNSLDTEDEKLHQEWLEMQKKMWDSAIDQYNEALRLGVAKEQARVLLPEGLTKTRYYQSGTIRSFIHYCQVRMDPTTQKEHREIANAIWRIFERELPTISEALKNEKE